MGMGGLEKIFHFHGLVWVEKEFHGLVWVGKDFFGISWVGVGRRG